MPTLTRALTLLMLAATLGHPALAQESFADQERRTMEERFIGITTDGLPEKELFERIKTDADMAPVLAATRALLDGLDTDQRSRTLFAADDIQWQRWINIHRFPRQGISLQDMSEEQRQRAFGLLRASLSAKGYKTSRDIMRLNHHLGELVSNPESYGEFLYWFAVLGEPSETEPWGWQLEGHHLIINFFVLGDQIVMTPTFMGSEPVTAKSGKYAGVEVLQDEQNAGLAFDAVAEPSAAEEGAHRQQGKLWRKRRRGIQGQSGVTF